MSTRLRGWRALAAALTAAAALVAMTVTPAAAITNGTPDGNGHPYVGLMTAHASNGNYLWRCSGTLLNAHVFVTAGHCTEAPAAYAVVFFDTGPIIPDPAFTLVTRSCVGIAGYPCGGPNSYTGAIFTHPQFDTNAFFLHDLGVVVLDGAGKNPGSFGALPALNSENALHPGRSTTFTSVGYGLQASFPDAASRKNVGIRQRLVAHPWLHQINGGIVGDYALLLSNNAASGGTCFGDSGGPNFIGTSNVLAGVTSFGLNITCGGTGGVYRLDTADDLTWLANTFGVTP
ncbi:MAG: S1 family peptidase [Chloroflexi bacterium]|nr:MAG: S1 family peptidase [Chloroflexota bacterium]